MNWNSNKA